MKLSQNVINNTDKIDVFTNLKFQFTQSNFD